MFTMMMRSMSMEDGLKKRIFEDIINFSQSAIFIFDEEDNLAFSNNKGTKLLHYLNLTEENFNLKDVLEDRRFAGIDDVSESFHKEVSIKHKNVSRKYNCSFNKVYNDEFIGSYLLFSEFTTKEKENELQKYELEHDAITDFYNMQAFYKYAEEIVKNSPNTRYLIVYSDIKDFKLINENYGQDVGNEVLFEISNYLRRFASDRTIIGRLEADHFAMCMPQTELDVNELKEHSWIGVKVKGFNLVARNVYGVYVMQKDEKIDIASMCERARMALDCDGLNKKVAFYDDFMRIRQVKERHILRHFASYVKEGKFLVYMQPQFDLKSGKLVSAEALVRLRRTSGITVPDDFVPILEKNGFITEMDYYVWEETARFLRKCLDNKSEVMPISVNVSARDFEKINVNNAFCILTKKYNIPHELIRLEIDEADLAGDEKIRRAIAVMRKNGFFVEIDNFSGGYSVLNSLKEMPIDIVKLNVDCIKKNNSESDEITILEGIIRILKNIRMTVIAEGVETKEQQELLMNLGCDIIQGYYHSKPLPMDNFYRMLK